MCRSNTGRNVELHRTLDVALGRTLKQKDGCGAVVRDEKLDVRLSTERRMFGSFSGLPATFCCCLCVCLNVVLACKTVSGKFYKFQLISYNLKSKINPSSCALDSNEGYGYP